MSIQIISGLCSISDIESFISGLKDISAKYNVVIQAFDADKIAGEEHLRFAAEKASQAVESSKAIADELALEIMLYASGSRQIGKAIKMGIHRGENNIAIVIVGDGSGVRKELEKLVREDDVLRYKPSKDGMLMRTFGITEAEVEAAGRDRIPDLVLERVALLDILK
ncbi:MAG TPA: hypothetical protein HA257_02855 [Candidatus Methanoperedenaceae archaeon]|nr:hypothetical protein [Candidatus Methanoperedenaceae archaeon]